LYIADNLSGLRKITLVPKKLNDAVFCKNPTLKMNLLEILKMSLRILRDISEQSKEGVFSKKREYQDFVKYNIVFKYFKID
jgi:hypothetical protein